MRRVGDLTINFEHLLKKTKGNVRICGINSWKTYLRNICVENDGGDRHGAIKLWYMILSELQVAYIQNRDIISKSHQQLQTLHNETR